MRAIWCACLFAGIAFPRTEFWAPVAPPVAHYSAEVTYDASRLSGSETVRFRNDTQRPIGRVQLQWLSDALTVEVDGKNCPRARVDSRTFLFDLPADIAPGAEVVLSIRFQAMSTLNASGAAISSFITPRLWWGQETLDEYEVRLNAPDGYVWAASGRYDPAKRAYVAERARAFGAFLGKGHESAESDGGGSRCGPSSRRKAVRAPSCC